MRGLLLPLALATLLLAACNHPDPNARSSDTPIKNPPADADPTPETGTGGDMQASPPTEPAKPAQ